MMKFPTPKGIATLVARSAIISECRRWEEGQVVKDKLEEKKEEWHESGKKRGINERSHDKPGQPDQRVIIGGNLSPEGKAQLKSY
ncbi:hypothetical protein Tco_0058499 [Tanacetum coccineum]